MPDSARRRRLLAVRGLLAVRRLLAFPAPLEPHRLAVTEVDQHLLQDLLDAAVGANGYALAISADHGVAPVPEGRRAAGQPAGRVPLATAVDFGVVQFTGTVDKSGKIKGKFYSVDDSGKEIKNVFQNQSVGLIKGTFKS